VYYHLALRYTRIFPNDFELIELDSKTNVQTDYHIGLINDGGDWGKLFVDFMQSEKALTIYKEHGLMSAEI
jgi:accessory colonization factor AcfC